METQQSMMEKLIARAQADADFRGRLVANPNLALKEAFGLEIPIGAPPLDAIPAQQEVDSRQPCPLLVSHLRAEQVSLQKHLECGTRFLYGLDKARFTVVQIEQPHLM